MIWRASRYLTINPAIIPRNTGPVNEMFVNVARNGGDAVCYGMHSTFAFAPAGYSIETALVVSTPSAAPERVSNSNSNPNLTLT
jgi:hypothetical protein